MIYKIPFQCHIFQSLLLFFFHASPLSAQTNHYGLQVIDNVLIYRQTVQADSLKRMTELKSSVPNIIYDLRYGTTSNFMHRKMYLHNTKLTFLRTEAARALANVQHELNQKGYGLKVFDAYRPYSVTVSFWELVKDERYVANPAKGSGHNRGLAIDLTIVDLKTRKELDMGTGFDNFSDTAHHNFSNLPESVLNNRKLLKETMEHFGFSSFDTEWWHYSWPDNRHYEVLDIDFKELAQH